MRKIKLLTAALSSALVLSMSLGNAASATLLGGKFASSSIPVAYGGAHRYKGNILQGTYNWRTLTDAKTVNWQVPMVVRVDVFDTYDSSTAWAWTYYPVCSGSCYTRNTIYMNQRTLDPESDFTRTKVATHELGHAIGLDHAPWWAVSVMKQGSLSYNTPQSYDINDINGLY